MMDLSLGLTAAGILAALCNLSLAAYLVAARDAHECALAMFFALLGLLTLAEHLPFLGAVPWWRLLYLAAAPVTAYIYLVFRAEDASNAGGVRSCCSSFTSLVGSRWQAWVDASFGGRPVP